MFQPDNASLPELRADCLRLRGYLIDQTTGLPALAMLVEDVRRLAENGRRVGVIYLDLSSEAYLESIYGWETYDSLLRQVAEALRSFLTDRLDGHGLAAIYGIRGDEFLLIVSRSSDKELRAFLAETCEELEEQLAQRLQIQTDRDQPRSVCIQSGTTVVEVDPMVRFERSLYRCLDDVRALCRRRREEQHTQRLRELRRIVDNHEIRVRYQPIVRLVDGQVHGYEALSCGPPGGLFESPEMLFSFAEETDHIVELERLCRLEAIRRVREIGLQRKLFLNCSARGFTDPELFTRTLVDQADQAGLAPTDIVIEITERVAVTAWQEFRRSVAALRLIGFSIAIDDMGAGYSSLKSVAEVQPEYLKVDLSLIRDVDVSPIKRSLLESLVGMANNIGSQVIAEGVEQEGEFRVLRELNVTFAQGYYFAPPGEISHDDGFGFLAQGGEAGRRPAGL